MQGAESGRTTRRGVPDRALLDALLVCKRMVGLRLHIEPVGSLSPALLPAGVVLVSRPSFIFHGGGGIRWVGVAALSRAALPAGTWAADRCLAGLQVCTVQWLR